MTSPELVRIGLFYSENTSNQYSLVAQVRDETWAASMRAAFAGFFEAPEIATPALPADKIEAEDYKESERGQKELAAWRGRLRAAEPDLVISPDYDRGERKHTLLTLPSLHANGLHTLYKARQDRKYPTLPEFCDFVEKSTELVDFIDPVKVKESMRNPKYKIAEAIFERDLDRLALDENFVKEMRKAVVRRRAMLPPVRQPKLRPWEEA
jgi:hypothetical protein